MMDEKLIEARKYFRKSSDYLRPSNDPKFGALRMSVNAILTYLEDKEAGA